MTVPAANPYLALKGVFHEPNRLAIVSALAAAEGGIAFGELAELCDLTNGNLSRHLRALEEEGVVRVDKSFVGLRPRTTVALTESGRERFLEYLTALEKVLHKAAQALDEESRVLAHLGGHVPTSIA